MPLSRVFSRAAIAAVLLSAGLAGAAEPLRVIVAGQTLMRVKPANGAPDSFKSILPLLRPADAVFTNFEAAVGGLGAEQPTKSPDLVHEVPAETIAELQTMGFNLIALSGNHSLDLGTGGVLTTLSAFENRRFVHAGIGRNLAEAMSPGELTTPHGRVLLISTASGKVGAYAAATATRAGLNELPVNEKSQTVDPAASARVLGSIRKAAATSALVMVYDHNHYWADPMTLTPHWLEGWAHACIDAGAAMFVEHGEPLLHGVEIYHGRPIFYSVGNFIFQTKTTDRWKGPEIWQSFIANLEYSGGRLTALSLAPVALNAQGQPGDRFVATRGWPAAASAAEGASILARIKTLSAPYGTKWTESVGRLTAVLPMP